MERKLFLTLLFISVYPHLASDVYLTSIPAIAISLNATSTQAQLTITYYLIGLGLSQLVFGPLADIYGRKLPLTFGAVICLLGSCICIFSQGLHMLFLGRLLQGFGAGSGAVIARTILSDLKFGEELARYNAIIAKFAIIILSFGPILGGFIQHYLGWQYNFLSLAMLTLIILSMIVFFYDETIKHKAQKIYITDFFKVFKVNRFVKNCMHANACYAVIVAWITATPILLQKSMHITPIDCKWLYLCSGLGYFLGTITNIKLLKSINSKKILYYGLIISFLSALLMLLLSKFLNMYVIIFPILFIMLGSALVFPNSLSIAMNQFSGGNGYASAVLGASQVMAGALSSYIVSFLPEVNQIPLALFLLGITFLNLIMFYQPRINRLLQKSIRLNF